MLGNAGISGMVAIHLKDAALSLTNAIRHQDSVSPMWSAMRHALAEIEANLPTPKKSLMTDGSVKEGSFAQKLSKTEAPKSVEGEPAGPAPTILKLESISLVDLDSNTRLMSDPVAGWRACLGGPPLFVTQWKALRWIRVRVFHEGISTCYADYAPGHFALELEEGDAVIASRIEGTSRTRETRFNPISCYPMREADIHLKPEFRMSAQDMWADAGVATT